MRTLEEILSTLPTPYPLKSLQTIYDEVVRHLLTQKVAAASMGACRYRDDTGNKCAVGKLIPNEAYHPNLEGPNLANKLDINRPHRRILHAYGYLPASDLPDHSADSEHYKLLCALQSLHENHAERYWADELECIAKTFHLTSITQGE